MKRKYWLYGAGIAIIMTSVACVMCFQTLRSYLDKWVAYSPTAYPLQQVEALIQQVIQPAKTEDRTPTYESPSEQQCKQLLREFLTRNNNQYSLVVAGVFGDHGTPVPGTGSDEVLIHVEFPDKTRVEVYFYAGWLETCRELDDE